MIYKKDKLTIDGYNVDLLAQKFKTPTYCYSYKKLKQNILNLILRIKPSLKYKGFSCNLPCLLKIVGRLSRKGLL